MKCAIVDIGSNTVQLTVYQYDTSSFRPLLNRWETVGLAGYIEKGLLSDGGVEAVCQVLKSFQTLLRDLEISSLHVFGTAALRNISNAPQVLAAILARTGIAAEILSGQEEAECSFRGARLGYPSSTGLMADVGGGSTELVAYEEDAIVSEVSLPLGAVALFSRFVEGVLPTPAEQKKINVYLAPVLDSTPLLPRRSLLAVGGSARAVVRLCNILSGAEAENHTVTAAQVEELFTLLSKGDKDALRLLLRVVPDRVHTVLPGLMILRSILTRCGAVELTMSATGVREGYLISRVMSAAL